MSLYKKTFLILFTIIVAATFGTLYGHYQSENLEVAQPAAAPPSAVPKETTNDVTVYVTGAVMNPGVVTVAGGSRVVDAVTACGGLSSEADPNRINMAEVLHDGQQITVPTKNTSPPNVANRVDNPSAPVATSSASVATNNEYPAAKININHATESELIKLPGVGPATAKKIIEYRQTNGNFTVPEDIKNVRGIGDGKYAKMKDLITT